MAFALSAAMMLTSVNMPEVTAWAQDTGKVTSIQHGVLQKILWLRNNEPHGTGYIELLELQHAGCIAGFAIHPFCIYNGLDVKHICIEVNAFESCKMDHARP